MVIDKELQETKKHLKNQNSHLARLALSKKKYQENLLVKLENQLRNIEELCDTIEFQSVQVEVCCWILRVLILCLQSKSKNFLASKYHSYIIFTDRHEY